MKCFDLIQSLQLPQCKKKQTVYVCQPINHLIFFCIYKTKMNMYNANVRTGNWFNELMLQEAKTKQYLRKNKNGELKVQKARHLLVELLTEIPLTFPVVGLSYGAIIEIVCKLERKMCSEKK